MGVVDDEYMVQIESYRLKLFIEHIRAQGSCHASHISLSVAELRLGGE